MTTSTETARPPRGTLPPRFVIRAAWVVHRGLYRLLGRGRPYDRRRKRPGA